MNNCKVTFCELKSRNGYNYGIMKFEVNGKIIAKVFVKETEIPYYKELIK